MPATLPLRHFLLALAVVAVWGTNFVVIKLALGHLPPLLFAALRFGLVLFPALFFLARPAVPLGNLALYGLLIGVGQFGLLYVAMDGHISPGLASLVVQVQVFFTIGLSMHIAGERVRRFQWFALLLAAAGIAVIILHTDGSTTPLGLVLILLAALAWAGGNIAAKQGAPANILAYVVWSSAFAVPPLVALSLFFEGREAITAALRAADAAPGRRWPTSPGAIRCSATRPGAGCWRATRRRRSRPWPCWCRCSAWAARRCGWTNRCRPGSSSPPRW
jgi:O-acetylserine/cysteine efflux transporter